MCCHGFKKHCVSNNMNGTVNDVLQVREITKKTFFLVITVLEVHSPLKPNDLYMRHTAPLASRCSIFNIYSTNIRTEDFKHAAHSPFFSSSKCRLFHNATLFGSCIICILHTGVLKFKCKIPAPKG